MNCNHILEYKYDLSIKKGRVCMNERALGVFEQYELDIVETYKIRGNYGCNTPDGKYILQEYNNSNEKMETMKVLCDYLENNGIETDSVIANKEGKYVSVSDDGYTYILKKRFDSQDCNIKDEEHVLRGARNLGYFHKLCENSREILDNTKGFHPGKNMVTTFEKHNKEIINIRNYIKKRKNKNYFERALKDIIEIYYGQAIKSLDLLKKSDYKRIYMQSQENWSLNHGSYNHHGIGFLDDGIVMVNMTKISYAPQIQDVYDYLRKTMEKNSWDRTLGKKLLEEYNKMRRISEEEYEALKLMFSYPEKFWKIINYYYNSNKAWYSEKNEEKLRQLQNQEEVRWNFIKNM